MIGTKGFWIDENERCEIIAVVDEPAGVYEFRSLDIIGSDAIWHGFIENFSTEVFK